MKNKLLRKPTRLEAVARFTDMDQTLNGIWPGDVCIVYREFYEARLKQI